ncbi:MAG: Uma2 family endonuclease [Planctomycetia bacterium]|nr:Uma2 family endonuclease [Planctomycetia bacterium]
MSTTTPATADTPAPEFLENAGFRRFTVDEYHQMIRAGILIDGEPIELLEGWMVKKMSHGTPHDNSMDAFEGLLPALLPPEWFMRCQRAITLSDSEPEPDYAIVRGPRGRYRNDHPTPPDIGFITEFSVSSLRIDRVGKGRIYARAGIPVYWVVNVVDKVIEVYTQPSGRGDSAAYAKRDDYAIGTSVPVTLDGNTVGTIAVADVMG